MTRNVVAVLIAALAGAGAFEQARNGTAWVPQLPPFGSVSALAGFPDLRVVYPMAGALTTDVRLAERSLLAQGPFRFLRLTQTRGRVDAEIYYLTQPDLPDVPPLLPFLPFLPV
jgi:hypothetical protein